MNILNIIQIPYSEDCREHGYTYRSFIKRKKHHRIQILNHLKYHSTLNKIDRMPSELDTKKYIVSGVEPSNHQDRL